MKTFNFVYGAILGEMILRHADNLSSTLQHKSMSAAEGQQVALMTVQAMKSIHTDESFDSFWSKVNRFIEDHDISKPELLWGKTVCHLSNLYKEHPALQ